jgi:hypothetical protein
MRFGCAYALAVMALTPLHAKAVHAGGATAQAGTRHDLRQIAPKDCTRLNGRVGYYGNPWCNAAEQRAWDLWVERGRDRLGTN